jgi:RNA polymerase sigma factor (sigma-70 family)
VATDAELIRASLDDPAIFGHIFERHYDAIARYARRRLGDDAGEEVAARTFLIAFERRHRFDLDATSARPWLYGISTNLLRHHLRDERVHLAALGRIMEAPEVSLDEDPERWEAVRLGPMLVTAINDLPAAEREPFLLSVLGELTYTEIATSLDIPVGTVRSRIHRARTALRERLGVDQAIADRAPNSGPHDG